MFKEKQIIELLNILSRKFDVITLKLNTIDKKLNSIILSRKKGVLKDE